MLFARSLFALGASLAVIVAASTGAVVAPASAEPIDGTITVSPTSGNAVTDTYFLDSIAVSVGATRPFTAVSGTFIYQNGVELGSIANARNAAMAETAGTNGLDGNPVFLDRSIIPTNNFVSNKKLSEILTPLSDGPFELRYYYFASATSPDRTTDPYVSLDMTFDAATDEWAVAVSKLTSAVSLSAASSGSSVTLTATVKDADSGSPATRAAGSIQFLEGTTEVGRADVSAGVGTVTLVGVPNGDHTYTAKFIPGTSGDVGSTSDPATVNVGFVLPPAEISAAPAEPTGVSLSVSMSDMSTSSGSTESSEGESISAGLRVSVVDRRPASALPWVLTGQVGAGDAASDAAPDAAFEWTAGVVGSGLAQPPSIARVGGIAPLASGEPGNTSPTTVTATVEPTPRQGAPSSQLPRALTITLF